MVWQVELTKGAYKTLSKQEKQDCKAIIAALERMIVEPGLMDIQKIESSKNEWRLRVGRWRIRFLLSFQEKKIIVLRILPREDAYRKKSK